jgi:type 1 glutamine amidotransferase
MFGEQLTATLPAPLEVMYATCSGSESNDLALRIAMANAAETATHVVVMDGAYHGHTMALIDLSPYKFDGPGGKGRPTHVHVLPLPDLLSRKMWSIFVLSIISVTLAATSADAFRVVAFHRGTSDPAHESYVRDCNRYFPSIASQHGFTYEVTNNWDNLNDGFLANVQVVMFLDDRPWDGNQRAAFQRYIERGGGWMGFHVAAFTQSNGGSDWPWYHNTFLGSGDFYGNTWRPTTAVLQKETPSHPVVANLPSTFRTQPNEWYSWTNDLRRNPNINILLSIHDSSFPLGTGPKEWEIWYGGYYPVVWSNKNYRMIYVNMGHNDMAYESDGRELSHTFPDNEIQNRLIIDGLKWLAYQNIVDVEKKELQNPLFQVLSKSKK